MGKAARWLRTLFRLKPPNPNPNPNPKPNKLTIKWTFIKSFKEKPRTKNDPTSTSPSRVGPAVEPTASTPAACVGPGDEHAMAVAAASAAVAEAAVAAAHAAAAVVKLTSSGRCNGVCEVHGGYGGDADRRVWAAVVIQSCFRRYLARRALRALKGLVKLQALVRGHILRNKTRETMRCMQAMLRAQARARSFRTSFTQSSHNSSTKSSQNQHPCPTTPEKLELVHVKSAKPDQTPKMKRNSSRTSWSTIANPDKGYSYSSWSDPRIYEPTWDHLRSTSSSRTCLTTDDEERADRILEVDSGTNKPLFRSLFEPSHSISLLTQHHITHNSSLNNPFILSQRQLEDGGSYCTAENSPRVYSGGSHSDGSRSFFSGYSDCPGYMGYTESYKAKMRSHSAPKQRPSSSKRYPNLRSNAQRGSRGYPGSGRLDRFGVPVRDSTVVYYSGYLN